METLTHSENISNIIAILSTINGLKAEMVGSWLWLSGNTYQHKEKLKEFGFLWSGKHKKWYLPDPDSSFNTGFKYTYAKIKEKHGNEDVFDNKKPGKSRQKATK